MSCLIRHADAEDAPDLPAIERSAGQTFKSIPELAFIAEDAVMSVREHLAMIKSGVVLVAQALDGDDIGSLVGFVACSQRSDDLHVHEMSVHVTRQGQGIGRALLSAALEHGLEIGAKRATLTTFRDLAWNERFYASMGFETLAPDRLDPRLRDLLAAEAKRGLPPEQRCAMALVLG
jgi:GNAT superfamily N-acetyltransferase